MLKCLGNHYDIKNDGSVVIFTCWFGFTAEAENAAIDPAAESAAPVKPPDEPKGDIVEWKPPEHAELRLEEKTDDEGLNSNKTSLESLREANENNSNNAGPHWQRGLYGRLRVHASEGFTVIHTWKTCSNEGSSPIAAVYPVELCWF